jgi:hypothetical protein
MFPHIIVGLMMMNRLGPASNNIMNFKVERINVEPFCDAAGLEI